MDGANIELDALGVFSHPDDAELSAAGTLLKLKSLGYRTGVLDMTRGEMGTRGTPEAARKKRLRRRASSNWTRGSILSSRTATSG
jgi:LmbE family N-acetylglucosaminyl deacetylase